MPATKLNAPTVDPMIRAKRLRDRLDAYSKNRDEFPRVTLALAIELFEARQDHDSNEAFGAWLAGNSLDDLGKDDRAALINIGEHAEISRAILAETGRNSPQWIWREEVQPRVRHVTNTPLPADQRSEPAETAANTEVNADSSSAEPQISDTPITTSSEPEPVSAGTLAKAAVGKFPKADLVLGYILNKDTRTLIGKLTHGRKNGGPLWQLIIQSIESGAFGDPSNAVVSKPNLRLLLPWAPKSYAQNFDPSQAKYQKAIADEIFPVVLANRDLLRREPDRLPALVNEAARIAWQQKQETAEKERHAAAVAKMPADEKEVIAFGRVLWPAFNGVSSYSYDDLCHAVWFAQMLLGMFPRDWDAKSKAMQAGHLVKFIAPMLKSPGWADAVRHIFAAYSQAPEGECKFTPPPINFGIN